MSEGVAVSAATPFKEIAETLIAAGVSAVPVIDDDRQVLGMVSEADLLRKEEFREQYYREGCRPPLRARLRHPKGRRKTRRDLIKVFLRPDEDIEREVREALHVKADVRVRDAVVTLSGTYDERSQAVTAVRLAENIDGVVAVRDDRAWKHDDIADLPIRGGA
ncbi:CBS domain-containing protein [Nonomuraea sp. NPDC049419]|uniref:CBS domain-containing protein n=1 Tax=Nonomuraea sp. NPDC049419 TaxID=3155772 RepID=UPI00342C2D7D